MDNGADSYRRYIEGDTEGIAELIRSYSDGLIFYVNSIVHDPLLAEDIVEDTFIKLCVDKPKFNGKSSFKTWLYAIGRYTAIHHLRRKSRHPEPPSENAGELSDFSDLEESYIRKEERILLHRSLGKLRTEYSQILYLVYFEGFTNSDAAHIMKKNERQIRSLLYNAKKALRAELERSGYTYEGS